MSSLGFFTVCGVIAFCWLLAFGDFGFWLPVAFSGVWRLRLFVASVGFCWLFVASFTDMGYIYISGMFCLDLSSGILCFLLSRPSFGKETRKEGRKEGRKKDRKKERKKERKEAVVS